MSATNDGGPAFPATVGTGEDGSAQVGYSTFTVPGMSLRDWLAGLSMQAHRSADDAQNSDKIAEWAYADADSMLAARKSAPDSAGKDQ